MPTLTIHPPDGEAVVVELKEDRVMLGRDPGNGIVISSCYISEFHAAILRVTESGGYEIADLGSHNGTSVNGRRIEKARLHDGDTVQFGPVVAWFREHAGAPGVGQTRHTTPGEAPGGRIASRTAGPLSPGDPLPASGESKIENAKLRKELRGLQKELDESRAERDLLLATIAEAIHEHDEATKVATAATGAAANDSEAKARAEAAATWIAEHAEWHRKVTETRKDLDDLTATVEKNRALLQETETRLEEIRTQEANARASLSLAQLELHAETKVREGRAEEAAGASATLAGLRAEARKLESQIEKSTASRDSVTAGLVSSADAIREKSAELSQIEHQLQAARASKAALTRELEKLRAERDLLKAAVQAAGDDPMAVAEAFRKARSATEQMTQELETGHADLKAIRKVRQAHDLELEAARTELEDLTTQVQMRTDDLRTLSAQLSQAGRQLGAIKAELSLKEREKNVLTAEIARQSKLTVDVGQLEARREELLAETQRLAATAAELAPVEKRVLAAETRLTSLKSIIEETKNKAAARQRDLNADIAAREAHLKKLEEKLAPRGQAPAEGPLTAIRRNGKRAAPPAGEANASPEPAPVPPSRKVMDSVSIEDELVRMGFQLGPLKLPGGDPGPKT